MSPYFLVDTLFQSFLSIFSVDIYFSTWFIHSMPTTHALDPYTGTDISNSLFPSLVPFKENQIVIQEIIAEPLLSNYPVIQTKKLDRIWVTQRVLRFDTAFLMLIFILYSHNLTSFCTQLELGNREKVDQIRKTSFENRDLSFFLCFTSCHGNVHKFVIQCYFRFRF